KEEAAKAGFVLNNQARSLKLAKTNTIGILLNTSFKSFSENIMVTYIIDLLQKEINDHGYDMMLVSADSKETGLSPLARAVLQHKIDGIISFQSTISDEDVGILGNRSIPFVSLFSSSAWDDKLNQFIVDFLEVGRIEGEFFSFHAGRRYAYMTVPADVNSTENRIEGFRSGLAKNGMSIDDILYCNKSMEAAYNYTCSNIDYFRSGKLSIAVFNDFMALGIVRALQQNGIRIPEDVEILSCDDIPMASWMHPKLSTARIPVEEMVKDGCHALFSSLSGSVTEIKGKIYSPTLILRETTIS
ncbi:MAG: LacI family DNA-binding transcriptional regulator, partial [Spirochaetales bacterium]|nr:LacI family DNA-binding transcriptional regulator [Spirochaetales bacterium]